MNSKHAVMRQKVRHGEFIISHSPFHAITKGGVNGELLISYLTIRFGVCLLAAPRFENFDPHQSSFIMRATSRNIHAVSVVSDPWNWHLNSKETLLINYIIIFYNVILVSKVSLITDTVCVCLGISADARLAPVLTWKVISPSLQALHERYHGSKVRAI